MLANAKLTGLPLHNYAIQPDNLGSFAVKVALGGLEKLSAKSFSSMLLIYDEHGHPASRIGVDDRGYMTHALSSCLFDEQDHSAAQRWIHVRVEIEISTIPPQHLHETPPHIAKLICVLCRSDLVSLVGPKNHRTRVR